MKRPLHGDGDIKGIVGCRVVSVFSVGEDDSVLPSPGWVTHRGAMLVQPFLYAFSRTGSTMYRK